MPTSTMLITLGLSIFLVVSYIIIMTKNVPQKSSGSIKQPKETKKAEKKLSLSEELVKTTRDLIKNYQKHTHLPSCEDDIMKIVNAMVRPNKKELDKYPEKIDIVKVAHSWLSNFSFDLLTSGRYHLQAGTLNPLSCAENLMDVYKASMEYAVKSGEINEETKKEQYELLLKRISEL